jgi:hypothetical protein
MSTTDAVAFIAMWVIALSAGAIYLLTQVAKYKRRNHNEQQDRMPTKRRNG